MTVTDPERPSQDRVSPRAVAVEAEERTHVHAEHGACPHVIPRQEISKPVREARHPLPHWQNYNFMNPATRKVEPKQMYCERLNETMVCGGVQLSASTGGGAGPARKAWCGPSPIPARGYPVATHKDCFVACEALANVRFGTHSGLKSDIAEGPKSANRRLCNARFKPS
jgi:hypothetical protein